jgi:hypothetical protein
VTCRQCGTAIADKAIVCYRCGAPTADTSAPRAKASGQRNWNAIVLAAIAVVALAGLAWWFLTGR